MVLMYNTGNSRTHSHVGPTQRQKPDGEPSSNWNNYTRHPPYATNSTRSGVEFNYSMMDYSHPSCEPDDPTIAAAFCDRHYGALTFFSSALSSVCVRLWEIQSIGYVGRIQFRLFVSFELVFRT